MAANNPSRSGLGAEAFPPAISYLFPFANYQLSSQGPQSCWTVDPV